MIYFIQQGDAGAIKIGYTAKDDVKQRMSALQSSSPEILTQLGIMQGNEEQEKFIHRFFRAYRIRGEWFEPHPRLLMYIMGFILGRSDEEMFKQISALREANGMSLDVYIQQQEIYIIQQTLLRTRWNITKAAEQLGITFRSLRHRISKYKIKEK